MLCWEVHICHQRKHDTVNLSCRLDKEVYELLNEQAEHQGISMNSLMNSITKRHLTWQRFSDDIGLVPITKLTLERIFQNLDEQTIKKIASDVGGIVPRELLYLTYGKMDFDNLISVIKMNGKRFGRVNYKIEEHRHNF